MKHITALLIILTLSNSCSKEVSREKKCWECETARGAMTICQEENPEGSVIAGRVPVYKCSPKY